MQKKKGGNARCSSHKKSSVTLRDFAEQNRHEGRHGTMVRDDCFQ